MNDDPFESSSSTSSSATRKKRKKLSVKKAREVDRWFADKNVRDPTDSENRVLKHYDSYTRKSPYESSAPFTIVNYDALRVTRRSLPEFLPSSVIVLITMHGRTKEPFKPVVNVVRHLGTEFGKCYYNYLDALAGVSELQLMSQGFKKKRKQSGEHIKASILKNLEEARLAAETKYAAYKKNLEDWGSSNQSEKEKYKQENPYEDEEFKGFIGSRHHVRPKKIKKNAPMFNKSYSMVGDDGRESHNTHTIYVRGDLPVDSPEKDALFEIHTENTTLETIFLYLAEKGVENVTLFDLSCQEDSRSPIHRTRYGGSRFKIE